MNLEFDTWKFLAGLGTFLFGMFFVEHALKGLAGRTFKKFLRQNTTNPLKGVFWGAVLTAVLQSSSVVSLMVLAFVGAGILQLRSAIGIIFGSNLGTTVTGWMVATLGFKFNIESFAFPMMAIGGLTVVMFNKVDKLQEIGRFLLGLGFLFMGLLFMKDGIGDLADQVDLKRFTGWSPYLFFPIGLVLTMIIQSSSAAMVITLSALHAGVIPMESAAALVVGSDLGTTVTVLLGGIKGIPSKKRVALSHFLFNIVTDLLALALLYPLLYLITDVISIRDPLIVLVFFHSSFNLMGIVFMFPFIGMFARFLESRFKEGNGHMARHIVKVPPDVPEAAIEALKKDISNLIDLVMYFNLKVLHINPVLFSFSDEIKKEEDTSMFRPNTLMEDYASMKQLEGEIVAYYLKVQNEKLEGDESGMLNRYIHAVRSAMIAAKEIKDIMHNIREIVNSSNDAKLGLYQLQKGRLGDFYLSLNQVFHSARDAAYFERLADLLQSNQKNYEKFLKEIYHQIEKKLLTDIEISTLLNVNREIFNANRGLTLAIKDVLLKQEEAESFNTIPEI